MKLQINDPRLLQYVLNEISPADRQIVESAIYNQSEIQAEINELKRVYSSIEDIESEPKNMSLSADRKKQLFQQTIYKSETSIFVRLFEFKKWRYITGGLIAATFAFLVFNHSLKNEVKTSNISTARPTIPADSEMVADAPQAAQFPATQAASVEAPDTTTEGESQQFAGASPSEEEINRARENKPSKDMAANVVAAQDDSATEEKIAPVSSEASAPEAASAGAAAAAAPAAPPTLNQTTALEKTAPVNESIADKKESLALKEKDFSDTDAAKRAPPQKAKIEKKMFAASKGAAPEGSSGGYGSGEVRKGIIANETRIIETRGAALGTATFEPRSAGKFDVVISSRALEAEQIKTMRSFIMTCLTQFKMNRELRIVFEPHAKKYEITNSNPSIDEKKFAECAKGAFVQPVATYIKYITVETKSIP